MSDMISLLNEKIETDEPYICVTRPRRFGKSMMADMLQAYYDCSVDSTSLFENLSIAEDAGFKKHLNQYYVFYIDVATCGTRRTIEETIDFIESEILADLQSDILKKYPDDDLERYIRSGMLFGALNASYRITGRKFVFIIDEWDYLFRAYADQKEGHREFQRWLSGFLKGKGYVALAYMTGILPVKTYGSDSILNMFDEISIVNAGDFASYTGFSEETVKELCQQYDMDLNEIREWYDGYQVEGQSIYNPNSIIQAISKRKIDDYWAQSSTFEDVKRYITLDVFGLKETVLTLLSGAREYP